MNKADKAFIEEMVRELDCSIKKWVELEKRLTLKLGKERTEELSELWLNELVDEEADEFKRSMDYLDKKLIWVWANLQRTHRYRAEAGQTYMKLNIV